MTPLRADAPVAAITAATEANYLAYFTAFTVLPTAMLWQESDYTAFIINSAPGNTVLRATFSADQADRRIRAVLERLATVARRSWWQVLPSTQPPDIGQRLSAAGLVYLPEESRPVMTLDLTRRPDSAPPPAGLAILRVYDAATMADWAQASQAGFAANAANIQPYHDAYSAHGFARESALHHFVGYDHGVPVTSATLLLAGGLAGIYDVSTAPHARGHGLGTAITNACLRAAAERGYALAVLQASAEGEHLYTRLRFRTCYREANYEFVKPVPAP